MHHFQHISNSLREGSPPHLPKFCVRIPHGVAVQTKGATPNHISAVSGQNFLKSRS